MNYKSGSTWNKWDLHVHTPYSLINHFKGDDDNDKWEKYLQDLENLPKEVKVLGINDYLFIDGYKKLIEEKKKGRLSNIDTLFPIIEFRVKKFAGHKDFKRINFHVIFSEAITPEIIQSQFLSSLQGQYKLTPGLEGIEWNAAVTKDSLIDLGKKIKDSIPSEKTQDYDSDIIEGFNNLNIDEEKIISLLKENSYLKEKYLLAVGKTEWESLKWGDSSIAEKKDIINKVDMVFISSETPAAYENARKKLIEQSVNNKLLDCSDAHYNSDSSDKDKIGKCYTWIKADTTFEGLRHSLYEFEERIYIGDNPSELDVLNRNPSKYISSLEIKSTKDASLPETWFHEAPKMEFNNGLVAIIGNKGNGKSAIADIIGLLGNSHNQDFFSFLNPKKFLKKKPYNRGNEFEASLNWFSNQSTGFFNLSSSVDITKSEKVKYLPQSFLEKICSDEIESFNFENELKQVVYSHMDETQKMGLYTFDEYIDFKTSEITKKISSLQTDLHSINLKISKKEQKLLPSYKKGILEKKELREIDLKLHIENKPSEVKAPEEDAEITEDNKKNSERLNALEKEKSEYQDNVKALKDTNTIIHSEIDVQEKSIKALNEIKDKVDEYYKQYRELLSAQEIDIEKVIKIEIEASILTDALRDSKKKVLDNSLLLSPDDKNSFIFKINKIEDEILSIKKRLSEPQRIFEAYKVKIKDWEDVKKEIIGDKNIENSIEYYKNEIIHIDEVIPSELIQLRKERLEILSKIVIEKQEVRELFNNAYKPISDLIDQHSDLVSKFGIEFDSFYKLHDFQKRFLDFINQTSRGSFSGSVEGYARINEIIETSDFNSYDEISDFLNNIISNLSKDLRDGKVDETRYVSEQLKKNIDSSDLYDFLFGLDYLEVSYKLKLSDKDISELSPGERGTLLLIFYLLIDKNIEPLVIDQPEENLDNQSVYNVLVDFIKEARKRRQVIIVTHNPNLAVVCDADQIIRVKIDKENKNKFTFISGAIENPEVNREIVNILEGTKPAFTNRKLKYENVSNTKL